MCKTNNCGKILIELKCYMESKNITLNPLPEVEEDGQRDEQGGYG